MYTRTRLATDAKIASGKRQFNGIIDVYVKTVKSDGIKGLYRGFMTSCLCIFIYRGLYFGLYDSLKPMLFKENPLWIHTFLLGWAVTITSGLVRNFKYLIVFLRYKKLKEWKKLSSKFKGPWNQCCLKKILFWIHIFFNSLDLIVIYT